MPRGSVVAGIAWMSLLVAACAVSERSPSDSTGRGDSAATAVPVAADATPVDVFAVQLGAFSDSANASRLRDSLSRAGWPAYIRASEGKAAPAFRVRVAASRDSTLPALVATALAAMHRDAALVRDKVRGDSLAATVAIPVNNGTHGMAAAVRWAVAPDRRALLVVEDPAGVEAEPLPNGFVFADEGNGVVLQRDSVWDVEPSPDWRRIAVGLAFTLPGRERAEVTPGEWTQLARETALSVDSVKKAVFASSGMTTAYAIAQPAIYDLSVAKVNDERAAVVLPMAGGWRIGWTASGDALLIGGNPTRAGDAESAPAWVAVDLRGRPVSDAADSPAPVAWTTGPTLDASIPVDFTSGHTIAAGTRSIESANGWITAVDGKTRRVVGPGTALVATARGRFVAALVPNAPAKVPGPPARLVVYDVGP
ncbi:MAG: SPOR domain-containing protein [Gemmatimonadaceae bacterium]